MLFGARGTGKSHLLKHRLKTKSVLWIDLLNVNKEAEYLKNPMLLSEQLRALPATKEKNWVIVDEIQKIPKLLDVIHKEIEEKKFYFAISGSSARKLKRGGANLLAGRAFERHLFPLTYKEIGEHFKLIDTLKWGSLPEVLSFDFNEKKDFLKTYVNTYLKEEIQAEQLVRKMPPFRAFIEVAAQSSGELLNYSKIARDIGSDTVSVKNYYQILEDTLLGFFVYPFKESIRKRQSKTPKFYFFDCGILRASQRKLHLELNEKTYEYGKLFEHWVIQEIFRLNKYYSYDYSLSFMKTKDNAEIDLILERPGTKKRLIEIKSTNFVTDDHLKHLKQLSEDIPNSQAICISNEVQTKKMGKIYCYHWKKGLEEIFS